MNNAALYIVTGILLISMRVFLQFTALELIVIASAFVIVFALLPVFRKDTLSDRKRQDIEMKRAAIIAKRKAKAEAEARAAVKGSDET